MEANVIFVLACFYAIVHLASAENQCYTICGIICGYCKKNEEICPPVINNDCKCQSNTEKSKNPGYIKIAVALGLTKSDDKDSILDDIEVIDIYSSNIICENLPNFPYPNNGAFGGLGNEETPIICGGQTNSTSCHSLKEGSWMPDANLIRERVGSAVAISPDIYSPSGNSKLFVTGGRGSKYSEVLTLTGWRPTIPLPFNIEGHCMVNNGTIVMVIGGYQDDTTYPPEIHPPEIPSPNTFFFDPKTKIWTKGPALTYKRGSFSCGTIKKNDQSSERSIIVVGGYNGITSLSSTEVLDDRAVKWQSGPDLPLGISRAGLVEEYGHGVIIIGGMTGSHRDSTDKFLNTFFRLPHGGPDAKWLEMAQTLKVPRVDHITFLIPDPFAKCTKIKIEIGGGKNIKQ